jgi:ketosteroid isomerase-like protein
MRMLFLYAVAWMLTSTATNFASAQSAAEQNTEAQLHRLSNEEVQAFLNKNATALTQLWSDDLVVTNPLNKLVTKREVLEMIKSGFLVITSYDRTIEYLHVAGDVAIVAGSETVIWGGTMPLASKTEHLRFTALWINEGGGQWRELARHANIVPTQ